LDLPIGQALGHVNDDDRIAVGLGDPGGQLDRLLGGLGSVNRDQDGVEHRRLTSVGGVVAAVSIGRRRPSRLAGPPAQDGPTNKAHVTPSQLLGVVEQTMQPTSVSLWLRPSTSASQNQTMAYASHVAR
jgi:hypothetical protein